MIHGRHIDDGATDAPLGWVSSLVAAARAGRLSWSDLWEVLLSHLESDERVASAAVAALLEHVREPRDPACEALRLRLLIETVDQVDREAGAAAPAAATSQVDGPARAPAKRRSDSDWFVLLEPAGIG